MFYRYKGNKIMKVKKWNRGLESSPPTPLEKRALLWVWIEGALKELNINLSEQELEDIYYDNVNNIDNIFYSNIIQILEKYFKNI
jgi:hypothetical protein